MLLTWGTQSPLSAAGMQARSLADGSPVLLWAKGYFFDPTGRMHYNQEIGDWLAERLPDRPLQALVSGMNGCFTILIVYPESGRVTACVDRLAAVPVYTRVTPAQLAVSDDYWALARLADKIEYDPLGLAGMLLLGHTNGPHTMLKGVEVFLPGRIYTYTISDRVQPSNQVYWTNSYCPQPVKDYHQLRQETAGMLSRVFARYASAIQERGWTAEVALSGGLDSRLAAGLLHQSGTPVRALSYGPPGNSETQAALQVAQALSIPIQSTLIDDPGMFSSQVIEWQTGCIGGQARFTTGIGAKMALSAYDPNRVFITGHPGNLPTGQVTGRGTTLLRTDRQAVQYLLNNVGVPILDETARQLLPAVWSPEVKDELYAGLPFQAADPVGSYEGWLYYFHVTNHLLLEMRVYEHFGHWLLPYLDYELIDFYNTVPLKYRFLRRLHVDAVLHHLFVDELSSLGQILISGKSRLAVTSIPLRDRLLMMLPPSPPGDLYLKRHTRSVQAARRPGRMKLTEPPWGPDPLEYWWHRYPDFKNQVLAELSHWDGLGGMVSVSGLLEVLDRPMHPLFIRFVTATMLTLLHFQQLAERDQPQPAPQGVENYD